MVNFLPPSHIPSKYGYWCSCESFLKEFSLIGKFDYLWERAIPEDRWCRRCPLAITWTSGSSRGGWAAPRRIIREYTSRLPVRDRISLPKRCCGSFRCVSSLSSVSDYVDGFLKDATRDAKWCATPWCFPYPLVCLHWNGDVIRWNGSFFLSISSRHGVFTKKKLGEGEMGWDLE